MSNRIKILPSSFNQLQNLNYLRLDNNELKELPVSFGKLKSLNKLWLSSNKLSELPMPFGELKNLRELYLNNNQLSELPMSFGELKNLRVLVLENNQLSELPVSFGKLKSLNKLWLSSNKLSELPMSFGELKSLNKLWLSNNKLSELPTSFGELKNLSVLVLEDNQLSELPMSFKELRNSFKLFVRGNPLETPPIEVAQKGIEAIRNYFEALEATAGEQKQPLNEAKVLFVGQGEVGKTSLVKRLVFNEFDKHENKTNGINIENWALPVNEQDIQLNLWDFGGQEIMHATHQFFLTKRSLYILVLDARQDEQQSRIEYWLKLIQSFGSNSPIIIVINKIDQHQLQLNKRGLQTKYAGIQAFIETSCCQNQGINELKQTIQQALSEMPHIHDSLPASWFDLKQRLEKMNEDHISYEKYQNLCKRRKISNQSHQKTLLAFLHDLGVVLNFQDDKRLKDTNVLNPEWVTEGIYKLLNAHQLFHSKGVLHCDDLEGLLGERYQNKQQFIIDMMEKFELCFKIEKNQYLIPNLLPKEQPYLDNWDYKNSLAFQFHYDILPTSIMSRFIVKMNNHIVDKNYWFSGVILKHDNNQALVKSDVEDKKIQIWVIGNTKGKRSFLQIIRAKLNDIHKNLHKINAREIVVYQDIELEYKDLLDVEEMGETDFLIPKLKKRVPLAELLDGIDEKAVRQLSENTKRIGETSKEEQKTAEKFRFTVTTTLTAIGLTLTAIGIALRVFGII